MHAFIHIGVEKTGTTSIQEFLFQNKRVLKKNGFLLTSSLGKKNHIKLNFMAMNPGREQIIFNHLQEDSLSKIKSMLNTAMVNFQKEVSQFSKDTKVIFSSEHYHSLLKSKADIMNFRKLLEEVGFQKFTIIVFLRPQIEMIRSRLSTAYKSGNINWEPKIPNPFKRKLNFIYDFHASLSNWEDIFNIENIKAIEYKSGGSQELILTFLKQLDLKLTPDMKIPKIMNTSINYESMLAAHLNHKEIMTIKNYQRKLHKIYSNLEVVNPQYAGHKLSIDLNDLKNYHEYFQESNNKIKDKFGIDLTTSKEIARPQCIDPELLFRISTIFKRRFKI